MILGDSLLVMTSLAEKEGLKGKVQTIYFDPPYGIKFGSNWQVSTRKRDVKDGSSRTRRGSRSRFGRFGIRGSWGFTRIWLILRDRLVAAREMLTDTGSVFVQIGDENVHLVQINPGRGLWQRELDSLISFKKTAGTTGEFLPNTADYVLWYAKSREGSNSLHCT